MQRGNPEILGATPDGSGTNFAIYSAVANSVELCLFDDNGNQVTTMRLPERILRDGEAQVRRRLLDEHGIEVGGGLGKLAGSVWRIGLMGENAREENVERLVAALR